MTIEHAPNPVVGADRKNHLAYEITIVNQAPGEVTIESVQARAGGKPIGSRLEGESLEGLLRVNSGGEPAIPGGGSALLFMDVVVKIAPKRFAFYAHMQPGSLRSKGGRPRPQGPNPGSARQHGQNRHPHLHFHIMDGPSPLQSNGLPFVHPRFTGQGLVTDEAALQSDEVVPIDRQVLDGSFRLRMPMGLQVADFGR
jgi:hypothetical protein